MSGLELRRGACRCARPGCHIEYSRDPVLEVACPDCRAPIGGGCRRPSGHGGSFVEIHAARDLAADAAGAYGTCPLGRCGVAHIPKAPIQQELML